MSKLPDAIQLLVVLVLVVFAVYAVTTGGASAAGPRNIELAGGSRAVASNGADTRDFTLSSFPPASSSPVQDLRAARTDESTSSSSVAGTAVLDPGRDLLNDIAGDIGDGWLPTEEAFVAQVDLRVGNVAALGNAHVLRLLGDEALSWPTYYSALQEDGYLADSLEMPTDADVRRLWPASVDKFSSALWHWHRAAEAEENAYAMERRGPSFDVLIEFAEGEQFAGDHAWTSIFHQRDAYAHWAFLMRVAERLR